MKPFPLLVGARGSPLSRVQVEEVLEELRGFYPEACFETIFKESTGDIDLATSLRTLNKTDFFTKEIDQMLLQGHCRIAIHSAKDLPEPLPVGIALVALTKGIDASDSLVMREFDTLETLPKGAVIATSSERREEVVRKLRPDFTFRDLRGKIHARIQLLEEGAADGVVVAEAALIRLKLTHLNRLRLPGETTPLQGQLAILAREGDQEIATLFRPLDARLMPQALYLGPEPPSHAFREKRIVHCPLIKIVPRPLQQASIDLMLKQWTLFTHLILTSKSAIRALIALLRQQRIPLQSLQNKTIFVVGKASQALLADYKVPSLAAHPETAEGLVDLLKTLSPQSYLLWPHSLLSRSLIEDELKTQNIPFFAPILYDTIPDTTVTLPDLNQFNEILFSSPSTVKAFFERNLPISSQMRLTAIGPVTAETLAKYSAMEQNAL